MNTVRQCSAIAFSCVAKYKLDRLASQNDKVALRRIFRRINEFMGGEAAHKQVARLNGKSSKYRLRLGINHRLIADYWNHSGQEYVRVLDIIKHDDMDNDNYYQGEECQLLDIGDLQQEFQSFLIPSINFEASLKTHADVQDSGFFILDIDRCEFEFEGIQSLSDEQSEAVRSPLPLFLDGGAGSGKTTIAISKALREAIERPDQNYLYITRSFSLYKYSENLIKRWNDSVVPTNLKVTYLEDYLLSSIKAVAPDRHKSICKHQLFTLLNFLRVYQTNIETNPLGFTDTWEQIRGFIKGSATACENPDGLISFDDYSSTAATLPKTRNLTSEQVQSIYRLAVRYHKQLEAKERYDEVDLARIFITHCLPQIEERFDAVLCDEVQDLVPIQILAIAGVCNQVYEEPKLLFAGDLDQVINPSGFSWERLRNTISETIPLDYLRARIQKAAVSRLNINFRSPGYIAELAKRVNPNQHSNVQIKNFHAQIDKPLQIFGQFGNDLFEDRGIDSNCAILVSNNDIRNELRKVYAGSGFAKRIYSIQDAKGLEFDIVIVWKFFDRLNAWQSQSDRARNEVSGYEDNLLYVAVTRAREKIIFLDRTNPSHWDEIAADLIEVKPLTEVNLADYLSLERDEYADARDYEQQGAYEAAIEIYEALGKVDDALRVKALNFQKNYQFENAGDVLLQIGNYEEAYDCYQRVSDRLWQDKFTGLTKQDWNTLGNTLRKRLLHQAAAHCFEQSDQFDLVVKCLTHIQHWEELGDFYIRQDLKEVAKEAYEKHIANSPELKDPNVWLARKLNDRPALALAYQENGNYLEAAKVYEQLKDFQQAALCYQKANKLDRAAQSYMKVSQWEDALDLWQKVGNQRQVAFCYENLGNFEKAAKLFQKENCLREELNCRLKTENWRRAAVLQQQLGLFEDAAQSYERLEKWQSAGIAWVKANQLDSAIVCYRMAKSYAESAKLLKRLERWEEAAQEWEQASKWKQAADMWVKHGDYEKAALNFGKAKSWQKAAECLIKIDKLFFAANAYRKAGLWEKSALLLMSLKEWKEAAADWKKANNLEKVIHCYEQGNCLVELAKLYIENSEWEKAAETCEALEKWDVAGACWLKANHLGLAFSAYKTAENWDKVVSLSLQVGNLEEAERALKYLPDSPEKEAYTHIFENCWLDVAQLAEKNNNISKAVEAYGKAGLYLKVCRLLIQTGQIDEAIALSRQYNSIEIDAELIAWIGLLEKQQKWEEAGDLILKVTPQDLRRAYQCYEKAGARDKTDHLARKLGYVRVPVKRANQASEPEPITLGDVVLGVLNRIERFLNGD